MQYKRGRQGAVAQDLVVALLIALIHPKPVLITSSFHLRQLELQVEDIGDALTDAFDPDYCVVNCSAETSWSTLEALFIHNKSNTVILLKRIDRLSADVQLQLGYSLMQPSSRMKEFLNNSALVFTTKARLEKLHQFLRRQILIKTDLDLIDENCAMVELPDVAPQLKPRTYFDEIRNSIHNTTIVPELLRYIQDIITYIRTHRLSRVGVRPQAAADFELIVRTLCVLEGRSFATPLVIKQAARMTLPVHVRLCSSEDEPSLQYGGDISVVKSWIKEWDGDVLVDYVLEDVPVPG